MHPWEALGTELSETPLPASWFELRQLIVESIERAIGQPLTLNEAHESVYVPDFDPGHGMSAGYAHLAWWLHTGPYPHRPLRRGSTPRRGEGVPAASETSGSAALWTSGSRVHGLGSWSGGVV